SHSWVTPTTSSSSPSANSSSVAWGTRLTIRINENVGPPLPARSAGRFLLLSLGNLLAMALLSEADVDSRLAGLDGWRREQDSIVRDFEFTDFAAAMAFVQRVGEA